MHPRAIETRYAGYRFRSRLEARWAVFFDALGLKWEYEPEGFELPGGVRYLPDFWIPTLNMFVEVKPPLNKEVDTMKPWLLSRQGHFVAVVSAFPAAGDPISEYPSAFGPFIPGNNHHTVFDGVGSWFKPMREGDDSWVSALKNTREQSARLLKAADAARSARFEHGENGARR